MESALPAWAFHPWYPLQAAVLFRVLFQSLSRAALNFPQVHEEHWLQGPQTHSLFSDQSCAMSGSFILLGLALIHGDLYLLSASLSTDSIIGQSFITKLDLV